MRVRGALCFVLAMSFATSCFVTIEDLETPNGGAGSAGADASLGGTGAVATSGGASGAGGGGGAGASAGSGGSAGGGGLDGSAGSNDGSAGSAGSPDATAACLLPLQEDFGDGVIGAVWTAYANAPSVTVKESGGELVVALPASTPSSVYGGIFTGYVQDVTGCAAFVEVRTVPNPATKAYSHFALQADADNYVEFLLTGPELLAQRWSAGTASVVSQTKFDAVLHRFWMLREAAGMIEWRTSSDTKLWQTFASAPFPTVFDPKQVRVALGAGTYQPETNPGSASFDNLNLAP